jgi:hypothetical protein
VPKSKLGSERILCTGGGIDTSISRLHLWNVTLTVTHRNRSLQDKSCEYCGDVLLGKDNIRYEFLSGDKGGNSLDLSARTERDFEGRSTKERIVLAILLRLWLSTVPFHLRYRKAVVKGVMEGLPCSSN